MRIMPKKRPPREITEKDVEELRRVTADLKKREITYPEPGGGEMIIKDVCKVTYPEVGGGEMLIKKESEIDTHRVELKELRPMPKVKITYPEDVVKFVREMEDYDREYFKIIWLDTKSRAIGVENISQGSINQAVIHPREAAKGAILANAAGVLLIHNHPSGVPEPSREDDAVIDKLKKVFDLVGIKVVDALIIAKEGYYSYTAQGRLDKQLTGGIERIMESREDDACTLALKAATETLRKYCGSAEESAGELDERPLKDRYKDFIKELQSVIEKLPPREMGGFERGRIYAEAFNQLRKKYNIPISIPKEIIEEVGDIP